MYNDRWLFSSCFTFWEQFMDILVNALSIRAVYWCKMSQNIPNIHILWAFIWLNEFRLKANGCIICSTIYFPTEIDMHYVADCIAQKHIFHAFGWKIRSWAVRKPLPGHQECCLAHRNRYAASLRLTYRWKLTKIQDCKLVCKFLYNHQSPFICWEILILLERLYHRQDLHSKLSCTNYLLLSYFCGTLYYGKPLSKPMTIFVLYSNESEKLSF